MRVNFFRSLVTAAARSSSTAVAADSATISNKAAAIAPKPISEIPGPLKLPFIGSVWIFLPIIGYANMLKLHHVAERHYKKYGPIYCETLPNGDKIVSVFSAKDIEAVFTSEFHTPKRDSFRIVDHFRRTRPHIYNNGGLFPSNGDLWRNLRKTLQKPVGQLKEVKQDLPLVDQITAEFVQDCLSSMTKPIDYLAANFRLNLEIMWMTLFGERLYCWSEEQMKTTSLPSKLIKNSVELNNYIYLTDQTEEYWLKKKTESSKKAEKCLLILEDALLKEIDKVRDRANLNEDNCIAAKYFNDDVDRKDINSVVQDLVTGGIDSASNVTSFLFYFVTQHHRVQEQLHAEAKSLLNGPATPQILNDAQYTRAVMKETLRLSPVGIGNARSLTKDLVLSGYLIPKGTMVITQNQTACKQESNFTRANEFLPERWLKDWPEEKPSPYLSMPFSLGLRSCLARRRAEQNLMLITLRVFRDYKVKWCGTKELGMITPFINKPDAPVLLAFEKR